MDRHAWTVEQLGLTGAERVLEVGCGPGVTASLVCERLESGTLLAVDRSAKSVALAAKRNAAHVEAGRAEFRAARAEDLGAERFDRVFSMNVRELWSAPHLVLDRLSPGGVALWVFQLPSWTVADVERRTRPLVEAVGGEVLRSDAAFGVRVRA